MILFIECIVLIVLFTLIVIPNTIKNPLSMIGDYPPAIRERCIELGIIEHREKTFNKTEIIKKILAVIVLTISFVYMLYSINDVHTFKDAFIQSYVIWLVIAWYDALIIDCLFFCHSRKTRIPGTENMKEYQDYMFHIKSSLQGSMIGIPACILIALIVSLL